MERNKEVFPNILKNTQSLDAFMDDALGTAEEINILLKKALSEASLLSPELLSENAKKMISEGIQLQTLLEKVLLHEAAIKTLLGRETPQHILLLFQNKNEIRATGGFIGSLGFLEIAGAKITGFSYRDVYDFDWQLKEKIAPPEELLSITDRLHLRDANFSLDFPTSAERIQWFLEHEKGPTVDTVIAIDQSFLEAVLRTTGPIEIPELNGFTLTAENCDMALSYLVEGKFFGAGGQEVSPKQFLQNLFPTLLQKLSEHPNPAFLSDTLTLVLQKHLLAFSSNPVSETFFDDLGISGKVFPFEEGKTGVLSDGFAVSETSVSANKSDGFIEQKISHQTTIEKDGNMLTELKISRTHTWNEAAEASFKTLSERLGESKYVGMQDLRGILGSGSNKIFMHIFLPKGVEITSANGVFSEKFDQKETENFTELSFFFPETKAGETKTITLSYRLPKKIQNGEALKTQFFSQPGFTKQTVEKSVFQNGKKSILFSGPLLEDHSFIFSQ